MSLCDGCQETFSENNLQDCECGRQLCYRCFGPHCQQTGHVSAERKQAEYSQDDMRAVFDRDTSQCFFDQLQASELVARFGAITNQDSYIGTVLLKPDRRPFRFKISAAEYHQRLQQHGKKADAIHALIRLQLERIASLNQPPRRDVLNRRPIFAARWHQLDGQHAQSLRHVVSDGDHTQTGHGIDIWSVPLGFYPGCRLLAFRQLTTAGEVHWRYFLEAQKNQQTQFYALNGLAIPIYQLNQLVPLYLDKHNILDYLYFFGFFVHGELGPFYLLKKQFDKVLPDVVWHHCVYELTRPPGIAGLWTSPEIELQDSGVWRCCASLYYGQTLYQAELLIDKSGRITMEQSDVLAENLPYPLVISLSHQ